MNSKQKGKRGELELSRYLREHGFTEAKRGVQYKGGPGSHDIVGVPGHNIECKRVEALSLYDAYTQSCRDAAPGETPIVVHRRNGKPHHPLPWLAIISLDDYLLLVRERDELRHQFDLKDLA
jgi:hypothetical protein